MSSCPRRSPSASCPRRLQEAGAASARRGTDVSIVVPRGHADHHRGEIELTGAEALEPPRQHDGELGARVL